MPEQPTIEQKMEAARQALAALKPPVTESPIGDRLVDATIAIVWSQLALIPPALAAERPPNGDAADKGPWPPMYAELLYTDDPALTERIKVVLAEQAAISEEIRKDRIEDTK